MSKKCRYCEHFSQSKYGEDFCAEIKRVIIPSTKTNLCGGEKFERCPGSDDDLGEQQGAIE